MKAYKLTESDGKSYNNTQWGENVTHTAKGSGTTLGSDGWIHFCTDPLLGAMLYRLITGYSNPILWECETGGAHLSYALEVGCKTLTTIKQVDLPKVTLTQRVAFAILCAKAVCDDAQWRIWANWWLGGDGRAATPPIVIANKHITTLVVRAFEALDKHDKTTSERAIACTANVLINSAADVVNEMPIRAGLVTQTKEAVNWAAYSAKKWEASLNEEIEHAAKFVTVYSANAALAAAHINLNIDFLAIAKDALRYS